MNLSIEQLAYRWLKMLKIPISPSYLKQKILSHPDYPSLLSITDTLDELGIENAALAADKEKLNEIPLPFIAHTGAKSGDFILVKNLKKLFEVHPDFEKQWNGVVLAAEKPHNWKNPENEKEILKEKRARQFLMLSGSLVIILISVLLFNQFSWQHLGLFISSLAGVCFSVLIEQHELGISNEFTEQLCAARKNTDCDAVMKSSSSDFFKWLNPIAIGWADAGIIYFSSISFSLVLSFFTGTILLYETLFSLLAICSLPFTFFSVFYQWRVVKKWCPLCLSIVALLWIQFALLLPNLVQLSGNFISYNGILFTVFVFAIITGLWLQLIKPFLQKNKELTDSNYSLLRFKNNPEIFESLHQRQRKVDTNPFENELQLGNPDAAVQIMVACNPYCGPCALAHEVLHELAERNDIGLTIRFTIKTENREDKKLQVVEYILQLANENDSEYKRRLLHDWYKEMNFEIFSKKHPLKKEMNIEEQLKNHERWSNENKIAFTPTIFINGFESPKQYRADDLKIIIKNIEKTEELKPQIGIEENNLIPA